MKLTGDGTYLGSKNNFVTFGFTVLDEGDIAKSVNGYHLLCLLKEDESYDSLAQGLKNIIEKVNTGARDALKVDECSYSVRFCSSTQIGVVLLAVLKQVRWGCLTVARM